MIGAPVDGEQMLVAALLDILDDVEVLTDLPSTVPAQVVRVTLAPGSVSDYDTSELRLDVESFAATRPAAWELASRVHAAIGELPGRTYAGQQFDAVNGQLPVWRFWSANRHRFVGTYVLDVRAR